MRTSQLVRLCNDIAVIQSNFGSESFEAFDVLIDRSGSDLASAGQCHLSVAVLSEERA